MKMRSAFSRGSLLAVATLGLLLGSGRGAEATPVPPGGFTLVEITSIGALSPLSPAILAPGELGTLFGATFAQFPVIDVTGPLGSPSLIAHSGGLSLTNGSVTLELTSFLIDVPAGKLFAEVNGSGSSDFALFDLVPCVGLGTCPVGNASSILTGIGLNLTAGASSALAEFLGVNLPAGTPFGIVKQVTVVPEPGTALLLFSGLAGLAWSSRRRS